MAETTVRVSVVPIVADMIRRITDPRARLRAVVLVRAELARAETELDDLQMETMLELRSLDPVVTLREIGEILDTTPQRIHQILNAERSIQPT